MKCPAAILASAVVACTLLGGCTLVVDDAEPVDVFEGTFRVDSVSVQGITEITDYMSWQHRSSEEANLLVIVIAANDSEPAGSEIREAGFAPGTSDQSALTMLRVDGPPGGPRTAIYYLFDPPAGTTELFVITENTIDGLVAAAISFVGADPNQTLNRQVGATGVGPGIAASLPSGPGEIALSIVGVGTDDPTLPPPSGLEGYVEPRSAFGDNAGVAAAMSIRFGEVDLEFRAEVLNSDPWSVSGMSIEAAE